MGGADSVNENHGQDDLALTAREALGKGGAAERATFVVGIGASAGGLEPLEAFFRAMPPDSGMAFVVIQHLSPDHKSLMEELLRRHTSMRILRVLDEMVVEPNTVYLIPPKKEMAIEGGKLRLAEQVRSGSVNLPIDIFFHSLAQDLRERSIAIVLSGSGRDGSRGIVEINDVGGLTIAQNPDTAAFDSMPKAAIDTGVVELILDPKDMPDALLEYAADPTTRPGNRGEERFEKGTLDEVFSILRKAHEIDFAHYKPGTVRRRIQRRLAMRHDLDVAAYVQRLRRDETEVTALCRDLLIGVTRFFRDSEAFDVLGKTCVRQILANRPDREPIRVWSAGCATGEEAYTLGMIFREQADELGRNADIKIFATDVHRRSLDTAGTGLYSEHALADLSPARRDRFFVREGTNFRVVRELRQMIVFAPHNLLYDAPFTKIDLVSCRNLLIYLSPVAQERVLSLFHFALVANGILLLGPSETVSPLAQEFGPVSAHWNIFRKLRDVRLPHNLRLPTGIADPQAYPVVLTPGFPSYDRDLRQTYDALLNRYIPAGILVNRGREILHTFGGASQLLKHPEGRSSKDLLDHLPADLRTIISTGLQRAFKDGGPIRFVSVRISSSDLAGFYRVNVHTVENDASKAFIRIERKEASEIAPAVASEPSIPLDRVSHDRIVALEEELRNTKEHLQAVIEELETSNEELQATNEELVSSNEELQSTNEELHSVNEELHTVNAEYQRKIAELDELAADMDALLESTQIGVVFVDESQQIRKFTPRASIAFNLRAQDTGRPITDISNNIGVADLGDTIRSVRETGTTVEREVVRVGGKTLLMRVLPYAKNRAATRGVVLTFDDVSNAKRAEVALRQSEERMRLVERLATDGVWDWNLETGEKYLSARFKARLGYADRELENHANSWQSLLHPDDVERAQQAFDNHFSHGKPYSLQLRFRHKNGTIVWLISRGQAIRNEAGQCVRMVGTHTDITELKHAEAALIESEARFRLLAEWVPDVFWLMGPHGRAIHYVSPAYETVWGRNREQHLRASEDWVEAVHPADRDRVRSAFYERAPVGSFDETYRIQLPDGMIRWVRDRAAPANDRGSDTPSIVRVATDITEHKLEEERFRAVVDSAPDGLLVIDDRGVIRMANATAESLLGYASDELVNVSIDKLIPERHARSHPQLVAEFFARPESKRMAPDRELYAVRRDGREIPVEIALGTVRFADGMHVLASLADITERKSSERLREKYMAELKSRNMELDEFSYVASHDLQEPLRKLVAFSKLLKSDLGGDLPEAAAADLHHITASATRMQALVQDLLALSRAGKSAMKIEAVHLAECVEDVRDALKIRIDESGAEIIHSELPAVEGDRTLLRQLLQNLIVNAIKFVPAGRQPRILVTAERSKDTIVFGVKDNGIGIEPEYVDQIFAPFKRLHGRGEYEGTGVGLTICRKVVERHGGKIWVESEPAKGSHVKFTINAKEVQNVGVDTEAQAGGRTADRG